MSFFEPSSCDPGIIDKSWWGSPMPLPWNDPRLWDGRMPSQWNPNQLELELVQFFPLTEQIPLDLDVEGCDTQPKLTTTPYHYTTTNDGVTWSTVATNIAPQLTIDPITSVGQLSIGGIRVGLEKRPTWIQRQLHKLLGFNWKDR